MSYTQKLLSQDILPFWSWKVRKRSQEDKAFFAWSICGLLLVRWDPVCRVTDTFLYENARFILLPYPGLEPHQPVKDDCNSQPASLQLLVSPCPPFHADLDLVSFPNFSYCDFSIPFRSPWMSQSRRSEVQRGFLLLFAYNFALTVGSSRFMPFHSEKYLLLIHYLAQVEIL